MSWRSTARGRFLVSHLDALFEHLPERMDVNQVADLLGVSTKGVYLWLKEGVIPGYQVGRTWIILRDELKDAIASGRNAAVRLPGGDADEQPDDSGA